MNKKTLLITGGAKGIGASIVEKFALNGYNVCINYNTSENEAILLKNRLNARGCNTEIFKADITKFDEVEKMIKFTLDRFDSIDVLVNNAGIAQYKLFIDTKKEDIDKMINTSLVGMFNVTNEVIKKYMLHKKDGVILNMSSVWGMVGASLEVNYSMVKAGVIGFTKALAKEMGPSNIKVNAITPGVIKTDMISNLSQEEIKDLEEQIPLGKIGTPDDVSGVVYFLASEDAKYITGQVISPNGGFVI